MDGRYRPYPAYRPSGILWLGEIPSHWDVRRLKFVASVNPETLPETTPKDYTFAYIDIGNISSDGNVSDPQEHTFEAAPTRARRKVNTGDTIISTVRTYLQAIAYVENNLSNCIVSTGFAVLRPRENVHPRFLYYLVRSQGFVDAVMAHSNGVSYPAINPSMLAGLWGLLPPLPEQRAIAAYLDRETAHIDALIARKRDLLDLLERQRTALISHTVTKGLNPAAPLKDSGVAWLGEIPRHWEVRRLKFVGEALIGLTYAPDEISSEGKGMLVLRASNVFDRRIVFTDNVYVNKKIPEKLITRIGDILICSRSGSRALIGKNAMIDEDSSGVTFGTFMTVFRSPYNHYMFHVFNSTLFEYQSGAFLTSTINQLTLRDFYNFEVPIPPISEQRAIAEYLDCETARIDRLKSEIEASIKLLQRYRTALISAAVTGKIDVREGVAYVAAG